MKSIFVLLLFFATLASSKLEMVIEFIRHGARGPSDINWNPKKWGNQDEIHQLTEVGMRQTYVLGREMRKKYIENEKFLSIKYNSRELYVRSTASSRALQSASSHLYGLYPLGTGLEISRDFPLDIAVPPYQNLTVNLQDIGHDALPRKFQPIEIHSIDQNKDMLLNYPNICLTYKILKEKQLKSKDYADFNEMFTESFRKIKELINKTDESTWDITRVSRLTTNIYADIFKNNPLPIGLTKDLWDNMTFIKDLERQYVDVGSNFQRKFMGTPLFKEILYYLNEKINNPAFELKFVFFSGHYLTLTPLMVGLNISNWECLLNKFNNKPDESLNCEKGYPTYASQILIELHSELNEKNSKNYFVKIIYNGKEMNLCEKNKTECDFFELKSRFENDIILNEFDQICHDINFAKVMSEKIKPELKKTKYSEFFGKFSKFLSNADNGMRAASHLF